MQKNILIVTGSDYTPQVYGAFLSIRERGDRLYLLSDGSFEPQSGVFEKHFTHDLRYTSEVLKLMRGQPVKFDAVTIKTSEWLTPLTALLAREFGCIGNDPKTAFACRSKYHMRRRLSKHGVPVPRFGLCRSFEDIKGAIEVIGIPCVLKPVGGNASYGTFMIRTEEDMDELERRYRSSIDYLKQKAVADDMFAFSDEELKLFEVDESVNMVTDYLVEEFMKGPEMSVDALVHDGEVTVMGMEEVGLPPPPYFTIGRCFMPFTGNEKTMRSIEEITRRTVRAMGIENSPIHMELILTDEGPKVVEIACRIGGDNLHDSIYQTTGYNMMEEAILIALGEPRSYDVKVHCHTAMEFVRPEKEGCVRLIEVPARVREHPDITEIVFGAKAGDHTAPPPKSFDALGYVNARGKTREEAERNLEFALENILIEIE